LGHKIKKARCRKWEEFKKTGGGMALRRFEVNADGGKKKTI